MRVLPMNDDYFMAELYASKLLPGNLKADIESLPTAAKKATKFLDNAIKPSVENNDCTKFHTLLSLMKKNDDITIKNLANKIRSFLNETIRNILNQRILNDKASKQCKCILVLCKNTAVDCSLSARQLLRMSC